MFYFTDTLNNAGRLVLMVISILRMSKLRLNGVVPVASYALK